MAINERYASMVGKKYGRLAVERVYMGSHSITLCDCICDCGNRKNGVYAFNIINGKVKSCGCLRRENGERGLDDEYRKIIVEIDNGRNVNSVSKEYGISRQSIYKNYKKLTGKALRSMWCRGDSNSE